MPENNSGYNPEKSKEIGKAAIESDELADKFDKRIDRFIETYFFKVDLENTSKINRQVKMDRFNQIMELIKHDHLLTKKERDYIHNQIAEKVNLNSESADPDVAEKKENPKQAKKHSKFVEEVRTMMENDEPHPLFSDEYRIPKNPESAEPEKKELDYSLTAEQIFEELKEQSGCKMSVEEIVKVFTDYLKINSRQMPVAASLRYTNFEKVEIENSRGEIITTYLFNCSFKGRSKGMIQKRCSVTFTPILRGLPPHQTKDFVPKFFATTAAK
ncbi:MAG: hypothetical protein WC725_04005 [Patescibacteria group bacterium]|jgi:hypothetical protein